MTVSDSSSNHRELELKRPLAFIDLETTGLNILRDRIIEVGVLKVMPDQAKHQFYAMLNPEVAMPKSARRVHGITEDDLRDKPTFAKISRRLLTLLADCDLAGFNIVTFDIPLLQEEFRRIGMEFPLRGKHVIDVKPIYHNERTA
jgi:DNA polymerase III subunit epsilon